MKSILILCVGDKMPAWTEQACTTFLQRLSHPFTTELRALKPEKRSKNVTAEEIRQREWKRIQQEIPDKAIIVLLDERGHELTTAQFKDRIDHWRENSAQIVFIIGGADGVPRESFNMADFKFALSKMTLPHGLARVVLLEQLYRVASLSSGHPYHRG